MLTADEKKKLKLKEYYEANKQLVKDRAKEWKKSNPDKRRLSNRKAQVRSTYGMEWEEYERFYNLAEGCCEICGTFLDLAAEGKGAKTAACVDHCHDSGKVRGLLCRPCNVGIGQLGDNPDRLLAAYKYLRKHKDA